MHAVMSAGRSPLLVAPAGLLVLAYGMGVDSTAVLVAFSRAGIRPDLILFADTGAEKPETYDYLPTIQAFLKAKGMPEVIVVRRAKSRKGYTTLEGNCLANATLPSLAFGRKSCSLKWKREPQDKFVNNWAPAVAAWKAGAKVIKAIGYDAGAKDARRSAIADDKKYRYWYPLRELGWDRDRCLAEIVAEGLPPPPKSACFFCPASKPEEIAELARRHPDLAERICAMEDRAAPRLVKIGGLWRKATRARPASMAQFIRALPALGSVGHLVARVRARPPSSPGRAVLLHLLTQAA